MVLSGKTSNIYLRVTPGLKVAGAPENPNGICSHSYSHQDVMKSVHILLSSDQSSLVLEMKTVCCLLSQVNLGLNHTYNINYWLLMFPLKVTVVYIDTQVVVLLLHKRVCTCRFGFYTINHEYYPLLYHAMLLRWICMSAAQGSSPF